MKKISEWLSGIFSPLLVPTYAMGIILLVSTLYFLPESLKWTALAINFVITCIIPVAAILGMYKSGLVKDPLLNSRTERTVPYVVTLLCYIGAALFFYRASAPLWLPLFLIGGAGACLVNIIVNRWWKISAHAAAMGGLVALMFHLAYRHLGVVNLNWWITGVIIPTGLVMTARVYLGRHTLWQVLAGCANGFLWVWFLTMIR